MRREEKLKKLKKILLNLKSVLLAYSGGVDSTFLLYIGKEVLKENIVAVTATSPTYTKEESDFAKRIAKKFGVHHIIVKTNEFENRFFVENSPQRCYFCKKELFSKLKEIKGEMGINAIIDGTNYSDKDDFRPGNLAKKEYGVLSPLYDAKIAKDDIRYFSKKFKLPTYNKSSLACLASRISYGEKITLEKIEAIYKSEKYLKKLGFSQVRVRYHNHIARIEVDGDEIKKILKDKIRKKIAKKLKEYGFIYITVDLNGYVTGSMNKILSKTCFCNNDLPKLAKMS